MKVSMMETPIITEIRLKENSIQGLYAPENAIQSFWTLKAKIETAIFQRTLSEPNLQDHKKEVNKQNE